MEKSLLHVSMVAKKLDLNKSSMAAMSISALASFFADEPKSINRGENHRSILPKLPSCQSCKTSGEIEGGRNAGTFISGSIFFQLNTNTLVF